MTMRQLAMYFRIAFRNVGRNRRRTALTMASVVFGTITLVTSDGLIEGIFANLREYVIHSRLGHIQITKPGYRDFASLDPEKYSIDNFVELKRELVKVPGVVAVTKRFEFFGFISNGQGHRGVPRHWRRAGHRRADQHRVKYIDGGPPYSEGDTAEVSIGVGPRAQAAPEGGRQCHAAHDLWPERRQRRRRRHRRHFRERRRSGRRTGRHDPDGRDEEAPQRL
jgi:hypothetical protein